MKTILIIDDDPAYRRVIKKKLEDSGYNAVEAPNGDTAIDIMKQHQVKVDLILLDLVMPVMDGLTCYHNIKHTVGISVPVIILTNLMVSAYPAEIRDFIVKSDISLEKLIETINSYFP